MQNRIAFLALVMAIALLGIGVLRAQKAPLPDPGYPIHPDDVALFESLKNAEYSEVAPPNGPIIRPAEAKSFLTKEQLTKTHEFIQKNSATYSVSGPHTAGIEMVLPSGRKLQLPKNIYIEAIVASIDCAGEGHCPKAPYVVLRQADTDLIIRIEADNQVYIPEVNDQRTESARAAFGFLAGALNATLQKDK